MLKENLKRKNLLSRLIKAGIDIDSVPVDSLSDKEILKIIVKAGLLNGKC